jgi:hypothetical protein
MAADIKAASAELQAMTAAGIPPAEVAELKELAKPFTKEARELLAHLTAADVTPAVRKELISLGASLLIVYKALDRGREKRLEIEQVLKTLTEICETVPRRLDGVEARLAALERHRDG